MSSTPGPSNRQETSATPQLNELNINREWDNEDAASKTSSHFNIDHLNEGTKKHTARMLRLNDSNADDDECRGGPNDLTISTPRSSSTANPNDRENFNPASARSSASHGFATPSDQTAFHDYDTCVKKDNCDEEKEQQGHEHSAPTFRSSSAMEERRGTCVKKDNCCEDKEQQGHEHSAPTFRSSSAMEERRPTETEDHRPSVISPFMASSSPKPNPKRSGGTFRSISDSQGVVQDSTPVLHDGGISPNVTNKRQKCDSDEDTTFGRRETGAKDPHIVAPTPPTPPTPFSIDIESFPDATDHDGHTLPCEDGHSTKWTDIISAETLTKVIDGKYGDKDTEFHIVDCRFAFEYEGGHILGAVNFNDPFELKDKMFPPTPNKKRIFIMHCEFSSHRAPKMLSAMRNLDRALVGNQWPKLYVPELYLLKGGYQDFYMKFPEYCTPRKYVRMDCDEHADKRVEMQKYVQQRHTNFLDQTHRGSNVRHSHSAGRMRETSPAPRVCRSTSELSGTAPTRLFDGELNE